MTSKNAIAFAIPVQHRPTELINAGGEIDKGIRAVHMTNPLLTRDRSWSGPLVLVRGFKHSAPFLHAPLYLGSCAVAWACVALLIAGDGDVWLRATIF